MPTKTLQELNHEAALSFYEKVYFEKWKNHCGELELIVSPKCNLACKYCYVKDFYHKTFPDELYDASLTLNNFKKILNWLTKNHYYPHLDIFSGELLAQNIGYDLLDMIYNHYSILPEEERIPSIGIPTNFTFLCSEKYTQKIENLIEKFDSIGIGLWLSASFDGLHMEVNRPFVGDLDIPMNVKRDAAYYEKVAAFCKKHGYGFHPMVYAENIDKWPQNFDWFMDIMKRYDMPLDTLYLLEVRNAKWTDKQLQDFSKFLRHIFMWGWEYCNHDKIEFGHFIFKRDREKNYPMGWNILASPFSNRSNGISCNIQGGLTVRVADLSLFPCHRTMYERFLLGNFVLNEEQEIDTLHCEHAELGITIPMMSNHISPRCLTCPINQLCTGGCLGSQYENTKDLFTPIPTVCRLELVKLYTLIDLFKEIDALDILLSIVAPDKKNQLLAVINNNWEDYAHELNSESN